jgi:hypothetical protein
LAIFCQQCIPRLLFYHFALEIAKGLRFAVSRGIRDHNQNFVGMSVGMKIYFSNFLFYISALWHNAIPTSGTIDLQGVS